MRGVGEVSSIAMEVVVFLRNVFDDRRLVSLQQVQYLLGDGKLELFLRCCFQVEDKSSLMVELDEAALWHLSQEIGNVVRDTGTTLEEVLSLIHGITIFSHDALRETMNYYPRQKTVASKTVADWTEKENMVVNDGDDNMFDRCVGTVSDHDFYYLKIQAFVKEVPWVIGNQFSAGVFLSLLCNPSLYDQMSVRMRYFIHFDSRWQLWTKNKKVLKPLIHVALDMLQMFFRSQQCSREVSQGEQQQHKRNSSPSQRFKSLACDPRYLWTPRMERFHDGLDAYNIRYSDPLILYFLACLPTKIMFEIWLERKLACVTRTFKFLQRERESLIPNLFDFEQIVQSLLE